MNSVRVNLKKITMFARSPHVFFFQRNIEVLNIQQQQEETTERGPPTDGDKKRNDHSAAAVGIS